MSIFNCKKIQTIVIFLIFIAITIATPSILANEYYADVIIDINEAGFVTIKGNTNYPKLLIQDTQNYTSKTQSEWVLNISFDEIFSEYIFKIFLPKSSSIYNINSSGTIWIQQETNRLVINGFGENETICLNIQYQLTKTLTTGESPIYFDSVNIILSISIIIIVCIIILTSYRTKKEKITINISEEDKITGLTERQQQIMKLLRESNNPLTQTTIQKELNMPKPAVSRNIHTLERKGFIEIEKVGVSHFIHVKKQ
jgi:uncharacterized membrane protein